MAAAIIALTLEANPSLTWRDVQHIMVRTSNPANLNAPDWKFNGVGRRVSHNYGYGLMDAKAMVEMARKWISVPPQQSCEVVSPYYYKVIPAMGFVTIELDVNSCPGVRLVLVTNISFKRLHNIVCTSVYKSWCLASDLKVINTR